MRQWTKVLILLVLLLSSAKARAATDLVVFLGSGVGAGVLFPGMQGQLAGRVHSGFGFFDFDGGGGLLFEAAVVAPVGGMPFRDSLGAEGGFAFSPPKVVFACSAAHSSRMQRGREVCRLDSRSLSLIHSSSPPNSACTWEEARTVTS